MTRRVANGRSRAATNARENVSSRPFFGNHKNLSWARARSLGAICVARANATPRRRAPAVGRDIAPFDDDARRARASTTRLPTARVRRRARLPTTARAGAARARRRDARRPKTRARRTRRRARARESRIARRRRTRGRGSARANRATEDVRRRDDAKTRGNRGETIDEG